MQVESTFSQELRRLMRAADLKNATVAAVLGYDISYVSKWISGGKLPSTKNISELIDTLVIYVLKSADDYQYQHLCTVYHVDDAENLEEEISTILFEAYKNDSREKKAGAVIGQKFKHYLAYSYNQLIEEISGILSNNHNSVCLLNLLDNSREAKLSFLGIRNGYFVTSNTSIPESLKLVFNLNDRRTYSEEDFYNALYIAHLLTRFSNIDGLEIFSALDAYGKIILLSDDYYLASAVVMEEPRKCLSLITNRDKVDYEYIYEIVKKLLTQEHMLLSRIESINFRKTYEYQRVFMSSSTKCLIGHISEFVLPTCIAEQTIGKGTKEYESWGLANNLISKGNNIQLLVYETAITEFMLDGRADVFGKSVHLSFLDRITVVEFLLSLVASSKCEIRFVSGGFYEDFLHLPNPCIFLSDLFCYLRVNNDSENYVIYSAIHSSLKKLYHYFFDVAWNNRKDVVVSEKNSIIRRLNAIMQASYAISTETGIFE